MADNYIEKQYEAYEARKAAWEKSRKQGIKPTATTPKRKAEQTTIDAQRRIFVTGGANGIGRAIVDTFCREGCRVAFCDQDELAGRQAAQETSATFFHVDVVQAAALEHCMQQLFEQWGDIDCIINNVGVSRFSPITETTVEEFDRTLSINLRPVFVTSRLLALHRKAQATPNLYGRIVNISSTRQQMSEPGSEAYAASKGGIYSLTHALAVSLADWHITVNSIAPGWIQTNEYDRLRPEDHAQHLSRRVGKPEDIARMCLFLCQEANSFINGENINIDGGMVRKMIYAE